MPEEKIVPADVINTITEEMINELEKVRRTLMYKNKDEGDEFVHRVVALYGALILMLEKHVQFMIKNGYNSEHLEKLEDNFLNSFTMIEDQNKKISHSDEDKLKN